MDARELRIGNWVYWKSDFHRDGGFEDQITAKDFTHCDIEDVRPIPLTEQWLERFGFKPDAVGCMYQDPENDYYGFVDRKEDGFMLVVHGEEHKETYVKYVHQLQNLFYALTGQELKLKEQ